MKPMLVVLLCFCGLVVRGESKTSGEQIAEWRTAAEKGDAKAQYEIGFCYATGQGLLQNADEAVKWCRKAADQNYSEAQNTLGRLYNSGIGVSKSQTEAVIWWRKAADQGHPQAQCSLGFCYLHGEGVKKSSEVAAKWYRKSADQGNTIAQNYLGACFERGDGVRRNLVEAASWYRKAADLGYAKAQNNLGLCYVNGHGVEKNSGEAFKLFKKAADQGFSQAQANLGVCYDHGDGIIKNEIEGYKWTLLAAAQGDEEAKKNVVIQELSLSPALRTEGQRMAQEWEANHANRNLVQEENQPIATDGPKVSGTGFLITRNGYLVTNYHVVKDSQRIQVQTAAGLQAAEVVRVDAASDLALLKVVGNFDALPVVSSRACRLGAMVATVGFPNIGLQGFAPKLSKGDVSSLTGAQDDVRYFQISVPIQPGNSGGALVDDRGNVVGVVTAQLSQEAAWASSGALAQNVNYAVKSSYLLGFLESVPEVTRDMLGARTEEKEFEVVVDDVKRASVLILGY